MITIEELQQSDYDQFPILFSNWDKTRELDVSLITKTLNLLDSNNSKVFVAKVNDVLAGYIQIAPGLHIGREPYLEIVQLLVAEEFRSNGIGEKLIEKSKEYSKLLKLSKIILNTRVQRSRAHVFYERMGFELEKISKFYFMNI